MASSPITSCQINGETMETVTDFIFLGSKSTTRAYCGSLQDFILRGANIVTLDKEQGPHPKGLSRVFSQWFSKTSPSSLCRWQTSTWHPSTKPMPSVGPPYKVASLFSTGAVLTKLSTRACQRPTTLILLP